MTLMPKVRTKNKSAIAAGGIVVRAALMAGLTATLIGSHIPSADAAGRTYKSQSEDGKVLLELCRLKKREYIDGGTNCIYKRQSRGKDVVIKVDGQKVRCQSEFQCKREK